MPASEFAYGEGHPATMGNTNHVEITQFSLSGEMDPDYGGEVPINNMKALSGRESSHGDDQAIDNIVKAPSQEEIDQHAREKAKRLEDNRIRREALTKLALGADY